MFAVAVPTATALVSAGVLIALAHGAPMEPPAMTPGPGATIGAAWLPVAPVPGTTDTTYTLSYDTTFPFTATQTVTTTDTSLIINGVDGVTYFAMIQADDGSGVLTDPSPVAQATADGVAPVSTFGAVPASPDGSHGWYSGAGTAASISVVDTGSGLQSLVVNGVDVSADVIFGITAADPSAYAVPLTQGINDFSFFGTDVAGNVESPAAATVKLDSVVPTCAISVSSSEPTSQAITADITAGDSTSGVDHIEYVFLPRGTTPVGGTEWTSVAASSVSTTAPAGRLTLFARSVDVAGNVSNLQSAAVFLDVTAPVTTLVTTPASPTGPSGSWLHAPALALQVVDADPSTTTLYSWNTTNTVSTVGTAPVVPTGPGVQTLRYLSVDTAGNREATKTATFLIQDQQQYTITPTAGAHGTIVPATPQTLAGLSTPTFAITPDAGYRVADVLVDGVSVGVVTSYQFPAITADHAISASFTLQPFTITPTAGAHGAISPATPQTVTSGSTPTFAITPDTGYKVADVLVNGVSVGAVTSYQFPAVMADRTISASFTLQTFTITPTAGAHGAISPATPQTVAYGSDATFTITPGIGYHVADVFVDGVSVGAVSSYTMHNVTANRTISATFAFTLLPTRLSINSNHTSVLRGHLVYFYGTISPNQPNGTHIGFYVKKSGSSTWTYVSTRHTWSSHHWSYYYHPRVHGTYYFQVRFSATSKYRASTSRTIKVVWR